MKFDEGKLILENSTDCELVLCWIQNTLETVSFDQLDKEEFEELYLAIKNYSNKD